MKRILPFLLAVPFAAYAFACSSDSDDTNNPNNGGNTENDGGPGTTPGTDTPVDPAEAAINPTEGVTPTVFSQPEAAVHGMTWIPAEKAWYVAMPTSTIEFDGTTAKTVGKVVRVNADGSVPYGIFAGTEASGNIFSVAFDAKSNKVWAIGYNQVLSLDPTGTALQLGTPVASSSNGLESDDAGVNAPFGGLNDIVLKKDGSGGFMTSPWYPTTTPDRQTDFNRIYNINAAGAAQAIWHFDKNERPNGIALSPDEKTLYVSLTEPTVPNPGRGQVVYGEYPVIWKWTVNADGTLSNNGKFAQVGTTKSVEVATKPDGLAVDKSGNVYVATMQGVVVFKPSGEQWPGVIAAPEQIASLAFGGDDLKTLYMGASNDPGAFGDAKNTGSIYKAQLKVTGIAK